VTMNVASPSGTLLILSLWHGRAFSCVSVSVYLVDVSSNLISDQTDMLRPH